MTDTTRPRPVPTVSSISMRRLSFGNGLHSTISGAPMARLVFAARIFPTKRTEAHNQAWRDHGDWTAWKYAMWERGEKFPSGRRPMKYATDRPYSDPEKAACRLMGQAQASNRSKMAGSISRRSTARPVRRQGHARGIQRRARADGLAWLARTTREWHVRRTHAMRRRAVAEASCVPELTCTANIKLNARVSLRPT